MTITETCKCGSSFTTAVTEMWQEPDAKNALVDFRNRHDACLRTPHPRHRADTRGTTMSHNREFARRQYLDLMTPAELAIVAAIKAVEEAGAHPLLTDAVVLLDQAKERVADFVDGTEVSNAHQ